LEPPKAHSPSAGAGSTFVSSTLGGSGSAAFFPFFLVLAVPQALQSSSAAVSSTTGAGVGVGSSFGSSKSSKMLFFFFFLSFLFTEVKPKSKASFVSSFGGSGSFSFSSSSSAPNEKVAFFFFGFPRFRLQGLLSISAVSFFVSVAVVVVVAEKSHVLLGVSGVRVESDLEHETPNLFLGKDSEESKQTQP
jgi:hypothetical protein